MRTAPPPSSDTASESLSSSTGTAAGAPSDSEDDGSYSYSSGSGSYDGTYDSTYDDTDTSSVASSSDADAESTSSDAASAFSAASDSRNKAAATAAASSAAPLLPVAPASLASSSDAIGGAAAGERSTLSKGALRITTGAVGGTSASSTITSSTSNGVTIDDADALVPVSSPSPASSIKSLADLAAPASPYHFSEEELARQPWPVEGDATTHTSEEGGQLVLRAPDALATIHTIPIAVPPPEEEAQRRRQEGGLPYPSHLTYRIVMGAAPTHGADAAGDAGADAAAQAKKAQEGQTKLDDEARKHGVWARFKRALGKTWCGAHLYADREEGRRRAEERAAARQRSYHAQLRSHHVPLVNFRTTRDAAQNLLDGDNTLPTVEEAAGYRHCVEDMTGTEAEPRQLQRAMRRRRRPASGLHWKTKYAYGRRAGGGPHGIGDSAFVREGDPQRFWIAQLHERSQVHLEQIETE